LTKVTRRNFLQGATASGLGLSLQFGHATKVIANENYRGSEDLYRKKWTWDSVVRGTHGTNCAGTCAFNVFVKNGVVWREEQQGQYEQLGDVPDFGPRGCQKGMRHHKYMYGDQRVLYPLKRKGKRGEGKWQRISWDQATTEIADKFLDYATQYNPECISYASGTQMSVKMASFASLLRFGNITGVTVPEFFSGVGDLPTGSHMTLGQVYTGDTFASVYKSKCVLVWMSNPAVTRIPDAHFFWEARYNGTQVIAISPEFTPTAMHSNLWLNPKPGTDSALAMAMAQVILSEKLYQPDYIKEQSDLPLLVRTDTKELLRKEHLSLYGLLAVADNVYYMWNNKTNAMVRAPGTGRADMPIGRDRRKQGTLDLGDIQPALEGRWLVKTLDGEIEVTTVFEMLKEQCKDYEPEKASAITGVSADAIRKTARVFAKAQPAMIYAGYASCKWLHGDLLQRAMLLLLSLTANIGREGGGLQVANAPIARGMNQFGFSDIGPAFRLISGTTWDYDHGNMKVLNTKIYGQELADTYDSYYQESIAEDWFPDYSKHGWKMGIFAGNNGANWRAAGSVWRKNAFEELETIVSLAPDMGVTSFYSDYVLPIAHHYERDDLMLQSRIPYLQVLSEAVPPLGESVDDWEANKRLAAAISKRAKERGIAPIKDAVDGRTVRRDYTKTLELYTMGGRVNNSKDVAQFIINSSHGIPKISFDELSVKGIVKVNGVNNTMWDTEESPFHSEIARSVMKKHPYETITGRQQFYIDHEWFIEFGEVLPTYKPPLSIKGYPLRMMMGHARHGVHSMWRDDSLLLSLQRGEPDIYVNPDDAIDRRVVDGDMIRIFNSAGEFFAMAHVSSGIQPGMLFMYHGWDPKMFKNEKNFGEVIATAGLIKPTSMAGDYGHLGYRPLAFAPNQTYKDFTCDFEKSV
jgi:DMSO reductase family type II enzyme molybdopterin subunit